MENTYMRKALKRVLLPALQARGYTGSAADLRRASDDSLDLLAIQFGKYGGQFILEFARRERGPLHASWGEVIPEEKLTVAHVMVTRRARLQQVDAPPDDTFRGFRFAGFGDDRARYDALALHVAALLPQVDAWLERGSVGEHVFPLGGVRPAPV
ncbi:MAG TPA: DUF4304 domain-containing protein [Burkholderiaceae bacterium]|jgi:hypothetical protein|nr:DUF4304 domain-containing protein [Burkholderiaceae bacterium]